MLTAAGLAVALPVLLSTPAVGGAPPGCAVIDSHGRCLVEAVDPGRPGGPGDREQAAAPSRGSRAAPSGRDDPAPPARPDVVSMPFGDGTGSVLGSGIDPAAFQDLLAASGPAPAGAPVDPAVLARRAVEMLTLPPPVPRLSVGGSGFVGAPVWLWIDGGAAATGPTSATATAGAARVTAVGRLAAVEWAMGPPGEVVRCAGPGTPWTGQIGRSPDCGYVYELRSLPERTGGTGRWTITATSVWTVAWSGVSDGAPVTGRDTVRVSTSTTLAVGEVQVLVGGGS